jgi:AraC family transcriptional regulator
MPLIDDGPTLTWPIRLYDQMSSLGNYFKREEGALVGVASVIDAAPLVFEEPWWRTLPQGHGTRAASRPIPTRWRADTNDPRECFARTAADCYIAKIALRNMDFRFLAEGRVIHDGLIPTGAFHVTEPGASVSCVFRGPYDVLHLHIPSHLIAECTHHMRANGAAALCAEKKPAKDSTIERLARALIDADEIGGWPGQLYAECISIAIITRFLTATVCDQQQKVARLAQWRLKRATDYIEAHLTEPVSLADFASASGLSRMYFAAQFRAATGFRPHEYLLRRRIERAQELLVRSDLTITDIAYSVGFQTQSHFTTVFNRLVGQTPRAWRLLQGNDQKRKLRGWRPEDARIRTGVSSPSTTDR